MQKELGFERHRAGCGVSIEKGRGKPAFGMLQAAGLAGVSKWFSSDFEGLYLSINVKEFEL